MSFYIFVGEANHPLLLSAVLSRGFNTAHPFPPSFVTVITKLHLERSVSPNTCSTDSELSLKSMRIRCIQDWMQQDDRQAYTWNMLLLYGNRTELNSSRSPTTSGFCAHHKFLLIHWHKIRWSSWSQLKRMLMLSESKYFPYFLF